MWKVEREMAEKMAKNLDDDGTVLLISYVQSRSCLWDENHADFKRISITRKLWNEIGEKLNITGDEAKCKWKYLKEKFKKLFRKSFEESKGSQSLPVLPSWKFYNFMLFLKEDQYTEPVNTTIPMTSIKDPRGVQNGQQEAPFRNVMEEFEEINLDFLAPSTSDTDDSYLKPGPRSSKRKASTVRNEEINNEAEKLEPEGKRFLHPATVIHPDERKCNDDHYFLHSLLPYIQALDPVEKLELRSQIQNLVTTSFKTHEASKRSRMYQ